MPLHFGTRPATAGQAVDSGKAGQTARQITALNPFIRLF
jgi:hypothetical protein